MIEIMKSQMRGALYLSCLILAACTGENNSSENSQPKVAADTQAKTAQFACKDLQGCVQVANGFQFPDGVGGTVTCVNGKCSTTNQYLVQTTGPDGQTQVSANTTAAYQNSYQSGLAQGTANANASYTQGNNNGRSDAANSFSTTVQQEYNKGFYEGQTLGLASLQGQVNAAYNSGYATGLAEGNSEAQASAYQTGYLAGYRSILGYDLGHATGYYQGHDQGVIDGTAVGYSEGHIAGYNSSYNGGKEDGYNLGYNDYYPAAFDDGYVKGGQEGYAQGRSDGAWDRSLGYSVIGQSKDTDLQKAKAVQRNIEKRAEGLAQNFGLSLEKAKEVVQLSDQVRQMAIAGKLTSADKMSITESALKIAGLTVSDVDDALSQIKKGNFKPTGVLMEKAAQNLGMENTADLTDKLLPNIGLVMP